jgi:hypothetical protein
MIIARNAILANEQDFLAYDEFAGTLPESCHYTLFGMVGVFSLCVIAEQSVCSSRTVCGSQQSSPVVRPIVNVPAPFQTSSPSAAIVCAL